MEKSLNYTTEALAEFVLDLRAEDLPAATVETVQRCVLDIVGAAAAGAQSEAAVIARAAAARLGGAGAADTWFGGGRRQAAFAAFANSAAASALDLDDGHRAAGGHPGAAVIPAVLAVSQEVQAGWSEALAALVAGYEVGVRMAAARDFSALDTLATGRWCAYGVAAAASRLRRLTVRQTAEAMAVAGVLSPGLSAAGYSRVMGNHAKEGIPWATLTGLWATELAAGGFTGPLDILDHRGYYDTGKIMAGLGENVAVDGVYFKPYACCRWIHCALDGLCDLMERHSLRAGDISVIEVHTFARALRLNNHLDPDSLESAQYSVPFCLAAAAVEGKNALLPLRVRLLHRPDLVALAGRVSLHVNPELDRLFPECTAARVVLRTDRESFESCCRHPLGDPANPMDWEMLVGKFQHLTQGCLPEARQKEIIRAVQWLPSQGLAPLQGCLAEPLERHYLERNFMKVGVRSEDKSRWERRVPLVPADLIALKDAGIDVVVQASSHRAFTDDEFDQAGVAVQEDLSDCNVIIGIKEIPPAKLEAGKVYLFFSHVIKGQPANMPMLQRLMELKATLLDYERIVDEKNRRLIFFGRHAGLSGMVNTLWSLGKRLEVEGIPSAFRRLKQARAYADLSGAREDLGRIAARIAADGVPEAIHPLVVGFTGYGNVSQGAQEILDLLPVRTITPTELKTVAHDRARDARVIYKVVFKEADLVEPLEAGKAFDLDDYYRRGAGGYRSVFSRYLKDLTVLVNCIYWDKRHPQLLTLPECRTLWAPGRSPKLKVIGDISCDVNGSVECTVKPTDPGNPVYVYEPATGKARDGFEGDGPVMMAVEILPSEIPRESSVDFSRILKQFLPYLATADLSKAFAELALPPELKRAVIVYRGELTPDYAYLNSSLAPAARP